MKQNLTTKFVDSVKPPPTGQVSYFDQTVHGLSLRVSAGGKKSWSLIYRYHGKNCRLGFGPYPVLSLADSRKLALAKLREVAFGNDPAAAKRAERDADTFASLAALYLEKHSKPKKRSSHEDERILKRDILPIWGHRKAAEIARRDVRALIEGIAERAPVQANRVAAMLSSLFNFALDRELVEANPALRLTNRSAEHARDRVLSRDEMRIIWQDLEHEPLKERSVFRLALLLGARKSEITGMSWSEVDLDGGWWVAPASRIKNRVELRLPLVGESIRLLRELRETTAEHDPLVFAGVHALRRPLTTVQLVIDRIKARTGIADLRFHDLRRTFATGCASIGIDPVTIGRLLNHTPAGITAKHYLRFSFDGEKQGALIRWDAHVHAVVTGESVPKLVAING